MSYGGDGSDGNSGGGYGGSESSNSNTGGEQSGQGFGSSYSGSPAGQNNDNGESNGAGYGSEGTGGGEGEESSNSNAGSSYGAAQAGESESDSETGGQGVVGGEPCTLSGYNAAAEAEPGAAVAAYDYNGDISDYYSGLDSNALNTSEEENDGTIAGSVLSWGEEHIAQPLQTAYTNYVAQPLEAVGAFVSDCYQNTVKPAFAGAEESLRTGYENYVAQPLNNLETSLATAYEEGVEKTENYIHENKALDNLVNHPENIEWGEVGLGAVQATGGITEIGLGSGVASSTAVASMGAAAPLSLAVGGYLMADGGSNFTGGISRMKNGVEGNFEGDTANFVKNAYIAYGPASTPDSFYNGANLYNCTQLGVGGYSLAAGVRNLAQNAVAVERSALGYAAALKGADTQADFSATLKNINYSQWTTGGLAIKAVNIDLGNIATRTFNFGIDGTNATQSVPSKAKAKDDKTE
ncbi:hypothetical protein [Azotosporobacter soli]|uniref:hypothetical protein n=1 Tax=Azotosporobacter soli TaxID=3055040 RepID=UPI0031FF0E40